jgi:hypothetical protein
LGALKKSWEPKKKIGSIFFWEMSHSLSRCRTQKPKCDVGSQGSKSRIFPDLNRTVCSRNLACALSTAQHFACSRLNNIKSFRIVELASQTPSRPQERFSILTNHTLLGSCERNQPWYWGASSMVRKVKYVGRQAGRWLNREGGRRGGESTFWGV